MVNHKEDYPTAARRLRVVTKHRPKASQVTHKLEPDSDPLLSRFGVSESKQVTSSRRTNSFARVSGKVQAHLQASKAVQLHALGAAELNPLHELAEQLNLGSIHRRLTLDAQKW